MANMNRADMINSLALAMGVSGATPGYDSKKYNSKTGTIYCNGKDIADDTIKNAIHYFEALKAKYGKSDVAEFKTVATYYDTAIQALMALQEKNRMENASKLAV